MVDTMLSKTTNAEDQIHYDVSSNQARQRFRLVADAQGASRPRGLLSGVDLKSG